MTISSIRATPLTRLCLIFGQRPSWRYDREISNIMFEEKNLQGILKTNYGSETVIPLYITGCREKIYSEAAVVVVAVSEP